MRCKQKKNKKKNESITVTMFISCVFCGYVVYLYLFFYTCMRIGIIGSLLSYNNLLLAFVSCTNDKMYLFQLFMSTPYGQIKFNEKMGNIAIWS